MIRNRGNATRAAWGEGCGAWELAASPGLSVKHEEMPPGTREVRHHHARAAQFFFVLSGELVLEIDGEPYRLGPEDGISVAPGLRHQAINDSAEVVTFLVVSVPPTAGDRIEASADQAAENSASE